MILARAVPAPEGPAASQPAPKKAAQGRTYRMKMINAMDERGFERPMVAESMLIPTDWPSQGGVTWNFNDRCNRLQITLRAGGPDGRAVEIFPGYMWTWDDNPELARQAAALEAAGSRPCEIRPPMTAADYIRAMLPRIRPNAQLLGIEPTPKVLKILQEEARASEQSAAQYGVQQRLLYDSARARLEYNLNGQPVEEWVNAFTCTVIKPGLSFNPQTMQPVQALPRTPDHPAGFRGPTGCLRQVF